MKYDLRMLVSSLSNQLLQSPAHTHINEQFSMLCIGLKRLSAVSLKSNRPFAPCTSWQVVKAAKLSFQGVKVQQ